MRRELIKGVRFREEEWKRIQEYSQACGLPPTTYLRTVGLKTVPRERKTVVSARRIYHLARIGNNLNQLLKLGHSGHPVPIAQVTAVLDAIREAIQEEES